MEFNRKIVIELMWSVGRVAIQIERGDQDEIDRWFDHLTNIFSMDHEFLREYIQSFRSLSMLALRDGHIDHNESNRQVEAWDKLIGRFGAASREMDDAISSN